MQERKENSIRAEPPYIRPVWYFSHPASPSGDEIPNSGMLD